ncbi:hypothetical protein PGIGA_G00221140, partial [Pangasianodon gigas]|nr:hypothetical protein [Pangasianodon gigas]
MSTTMQRSRFRTSTCPRASVSRDRWSRCVFVDVVQISNVLCSAGPVRADTHTHTHTHT